MLRWTVTFIILAIIAGIFGFGGIAAGAASIAKVLFFRILICKFFFLQKSLKIKICIFP